MRLTKELTMISLQLELGAELRNLEQSETRLGKMIRKSVQANREDLPDATWILIVRWLGEGFEVFAAIFIKDGQFQKVGWIWNIFSKFKTIQEWAKKGYEIWKDYREAKSTVEL